MANVSLRRGTDPNPSTSLSPALGPALLRRLEPLRWMQDVFSWDPFREMTAGLLPSGSLFSPDFEIAETSDGYIFTGDIPGLSASDIDISVSGNRLSISGKREQVHNAEDASYYCCERAYGSFVRSFTLPRGADLEHIVADVKNGVLTVVVPKSPETQPRKIAIGAGSDRGGQAARA